MPLPVAVDPTEQIPVAFVSRAVQKLITDRMDIALSAEQMESLEVQTEYIQHLVLELEKHFLDDSVLYCLMSCHLIFTKKSHWGPPSERRLMATRALAAVTIASHISHDLEPEKLARALVYEFYPLNQGDSSVSLAVPSYLRVSALELAIQTHARSFLMEPPVAETIQNLWDGVITVVRGVESSSGVRLGDTVTAIRRPKRAHSPRYHHVLQLLSATVFFGLYLLLIQQDPQSPSLLVESLFVLWSCGYALDEYNQLTEFGSKMYFMSLWNWIDVILVAHSALYIAVRIVSSLFPTAFPHSFMVARGILVVAGLFIVPRLFSVFDNNKVFSNMVFSLQRVSTDLLVSWFVVMMFSVGVWVSVAFSVPRVRLTSHGNPGHLGGSGTVLSVVNLGSQERFTVRGPQERFKVTDRQENGAARTALAMFKMLFGDNDSLWDRWFDYTTFDKLALGFYLVLAQFVMPTVVTAVLATSFASIKADSEEQFYYVRATQTLLKLKSRRKQRASTYEVAPFNVVSWVFEWLNYILPARVYRNTSTVVSKAFHFPGETIAMLVDSLASRREKRASVLANARKLRLQDEVDRTIGGTVTADRARVANAERRSAKFALINEAFTNEKITHVFDRSPLAQQVKAEDAEETNQTLLTRVAELEKSTARIEALLGQLLNRNK